MPVSTFFERPVARMQLVLDGRVLGGKAERVPAERVQDVVSPHHAVSRKRVADAVVAEVAHMDVARRIGEHLEDVVFAFWLSQVWCKAAKTPIELCHLASMALGSYFIESRF